MCTSVVAHGGSLLQGWLDSKSTYHLNAEKTKDASLSSVFIRWKTFQFGFSSGSGKKDIFRKSSMPETGALSS